VRPAISPQAAIALLRTQYPDGLICAQCGLLLATRLESYRTSNLTTARRKTYVCAECQQALADIERDAEARRANLVLARAARGGQKNHDAGRSSGVGESDRHLPASPHQLGRFGQVFLTAQLHRGGRPRKYRTKEERRQASRAYSRAYRLRRKEIALA